MKNKGFTLTELLVVIVILGIITGISIPLIRNLSINFENKKYQNYADSVLAASKLYNDSYSEDLFGHKEYGCAYITYQELVEKNLLKDIDIDKVSCNHEKTFVRVIKQKDKYGYSNFLGCGKEKDGKAETLDITLPKGVNIPEMDEASCTGTNDNNLMIYADETYIGEYFNKKRKTTSLTIASGTGISKNITILTAWSTSPDDYTSDHTWSKTTFKVTGNQEKQLLDGNLIITTSDKITTPENATGKYYLLVRVDNLQDLYGSKWKNPDNTDSRYISFGPFAVDNEKPVFNSLTVESADEESNSKDVVVKLTGSDNYTEKEDLKMCISEEKDECTKAKDITYDYVEETEYTFTGNNENNKLYVSLKDLAGNVVTQEITYVIPTSYTITYDSNGGTECTPSSKTVVRRNSSTTWGELCQPKKDHYTFTGWKDEDGNTITSDTLVEKNLNVKAQYRINKVIFKFKLKSGETLTETTTTSAGETNTWTKDSEDYINKNGNVYKITYAYNESTINLANYNNSSYIDISKSGHSAISGEEWICESGCSTPNQTFTQAETSMPSSTCDSTDSDCTMVLNVNWNGGLKCPSITAKVGGSTYSTKTWTNKQIDLTFNFSNTSAVKYDWYTDSDGGWKKWDSKKSVSENTNNLSGAGKRSMKFVLYDNDGNTKECTYDGYWIDKTKPTCSTSKSNKGTTAGVTVTVSCSDSGGSGCTSSSSTYTKVKSSKTYTVTDKAGNSGTCSVSVSSSGCGTKKTTCSTCMYKTTYTVQGCKNKTGSNYVNWKGSHRISSSGTCEYYISYSGEGCCYYKCNCKTTYTSTCYS